MSGLNNLHDMFFGELSREYCSLFYVLMVVNFGLVCLVALSTLVYVLSVKKLDFKILLFGVFEVALISIGYLQHRLLYSMCKSQGGF